MPKTCDCALALAPAPMITMQTTSIEEQRKASEKAASIKRAISAGAAGSAAGDEPSVAEMKSELEASVAWLSAKPQTAWR